MALFAQWRDLCTVHTRDACRRGALSVTPAVLMCGIEARLSRCTLSGVRSLLSSPSAGKQQQRLVGSPSSPRLPNQFWRLRIWSLQAVGSTRLVCQKKGFDVSWHKEEEVGVEATNRRIDRCVALLSECR